MRLFIFNKPIARATVSLLYLCSYFNLKRRITKKAQQLQNPRQLTEINAFGKRSCQISWPMALCALSSATSLCKGGCDEIRNVRTFQDGYSLNPPNIMDLIRNKFRFVNITFKPLFIKRCNQRYGSEEKNNHKNPLYIAILLKNAYLETREEGFL